MGNSPRGRLSDPDAADDLAGVQGGLSRPLDKPVDGNRSIPVGTGKENLCVQDVKGGEAVAGRRGGDDIAAQRAHVPDEGRPQNPQSLAEHRGVFTNEGMFERRRVGHPRPDDDGPFLFPDLPEFRNPLQAEKDGRPGQTVAELDQQVGPAGVDPRVGICFPYLPEFLEGAGKEDVH